MINLDNCPMCSNKLYSYKDDLSKRCESFINNKGSHFILLKYPDSYGDYVYAFREPYRILFHLNDCKIYYRDYLGADWILIKIIPTIDPIKITETFDRFEKLKVFL